MLLHTLSNSVCVCGGGATCTVQSATFLHTICARRSNAAERNAGNYTYCRTTVVFISKLWFRKDTVTSVELSFIQSKAFPRVVLLGVFPIWLTEHEVMTTITKDRNRIVVLIIGTFNTY